MYRIVRYALYIVLIVIAVIVTTAIGLYIFSHTRAGRDIILRQAIKVVEPRLRGLRISAENLGGRLPYEINLGRVVVSDAQGPFLYMDDLWIDWSPTAALRGMIQVRSCSVASARLERRPALPLHAFRIPFPPRRLPNLRVNQFTVSQLILGNAVYPGEMALNIQGNLRSQSMPQNLIVTATSESIAGPALHAAIDVALQPPALRVNGRYDEPGGGLAGHLLRLEKPEPVRASVEGRGPLEKWEGQARASIGETRVMNLAIHLQKVPGASSWQLDGAVEPPQSLIPDAAVPIILGRNQVCMAGSFTNRILTLERLHWRAPYATLTMSGPVNAAQQTLDVQFALNLPALDKLQHAAVRNLTGTATITGTVAGKVSEPDANLQLVADSLTAAGANADRLSAAAHIRVLSPLGMGFPTLTAVGDGAFAGLQYPQMPNLPVETLDFTFDIATAPPDVITLNKVSITNPALNAVASGSISKDTREVRLNIDAGAGQIAYLTGRGTYSISDRMINAAARATVPNLAAAESVVRRPIRGSAVFDLQVQGPTNNFSCSVTGVGSNVSFAEAASPATINLDAEGAINLHAKSGISKISLLISDIASLVPNAKYGGAASLQADVAFDNAAVFEASAHFVGTISNLHGLPPALRALTGANVEYSGDATIDNRLVTLRNVAATGENISLAGSATYVTETKRLESTADILLPHLQAPGERLKRDIAGAVAIQARADVRDLFGRPQGSLRLHADWRDQGLDAAVRFAKSDRELSVRDLSITAPATRVTGSLTVDTDTLLAAGTLAANAESLEWIGGVAGIDLSGAATANVRLAEKEGAQNAVVDLRGTKLGTPWGIADNLRIDANLQDLRKGPAGNAKLVLTGFSRGHAKIANADVAVDGGPGRFTFKADASGAVEHPLQFSTMCAYDRVENGFDLTLQTLRLTWGDMPVTLTQPAVLQKRGDAYQLPPFALTLDDGNMLGSASLTDTAVAINMDFDGVPLALARLAGGPELRGKGSGSIKISGSPQSPGLSYRLALLNVSRIEGRHETPEFDVNATGALLGGRLDTEFTVERLLINPAKGQIGVPLTLSISPFTFAVPRDQPVAGDVAYHGKIETVAKLLLLDEQRLEGTFQGRIQLAGTVAAPEVTGTTVIEDATFENFSTGTVLRQIQVELAAEGRQIRIVRAQATDGGDGSMRAEGEMTVAPAKGYPIDIVIYTQRATVARLDYATAEVSGEIHVAGTVNDALVTGRDLIFGPATFSIPETRPQSLEGLNIVEKSVLPGQEPLEPAAQKPPVAGQSVLPPQRFRQRFRLDLAADVPGQVRVRGYGLESEWKGNLAARGSAATPEITGALTLVQGGLSFLGREFVLTQGAVTFSGPYPPNPIINVTAEVKSADITAIVRISGPAREPQITLESTPPLPNDEILARVLFGRNVSQISPLEAIQLAQAATMLAGHPKGFGVLRELGGIIGLDRLSLLPGTNTSTATALGLGRRLGKNVRVDVRQGLTGQDGTRLDVEYELRPNLTLRGTLGQTQEQNIELNWRKDY